MKTKLENLARLGFGLVLVVLLAAGCATAPRTANDGLPQGLEERAQARWDHLVERDFYGAYPYYTPGFRQTMDERDFNFDMQRRPVRWVEAEVVATDCENEDECIVAVRVGYRVPTAPAGQSGMKLYRILEEQWLRIDGQWWYTAAPVVRGFD